MSSVQRFLRQRVVGTTTYSLPVPPLQQDFNNLFYVLQTDSDNYVGNYPPGNMINLTDLDTLVGNGDPIKIQDDRVQIVDFINEEIKLINLFDS